MITLFTKSTSMIRSFGRHVLIGAFSLMWFPSSSNADTLWYNGDYNGSQSDAGISNGVNINSGLGITDVLIYDDFVVPNGQQWSLHSLFSNNVVDPILVTQARWEIRSGVDEGVAGTLLHSGLSNATLTPTGRTIVGRAEYEVAVSVVANSILLDPGHYWLLVAPIGDGTSTSANAVAISVTGGFDGTNFTPGANAVGIYPGNNGKAFAHTPLLDPPLFDFFELALFEILDFHDFSMGVRGAVVPESSSLMLAGMGGALLLFRLRKRNARV